MKPKFPRSHIRHLKACIANFSYVMGFKLCVRFIMDRHLPRTYTVSAEMSRIEAVINGNWNIFSNHRSCVLLLSMFWFWFKILQTKFVSKFLFEMVSSITKSCLFTVFAIFSFLADCQGKFNTANLRSDNTDTFNNIFGHLFLFSSYLLFNIFSKDVAKLKLTFYKFIKRSYFYCDIEIYDNINFFQYIIRA